MSTVTDRSALVRSTLNQVEFYRLCRTLEADPAIQRGELNFDQVVQRYVATALPGRVLKAQNIRKALKASNLIKKVKPSSNFRAGAGSIQKRLWMRQKNLETVVRRIATQLGVDHSELDLVATTEELEATEIS